MSINNKFKNITLLLLLLSMSSCATIMHGTRQSIGIASNPTNAHVWVDQMYVGNTPIIVELTRQDNHFLRIELDGFMPYDAVFSRQLSGWVFGNIIFGGVIGLAVDAISGGIYRLTPEQIQAEMHSKGYASNSQDSFFTIVMEPKEEWTKVGSLSPQS